MAGKIDRGEPLESSWGAETQEEGERLGQGILDIPQWENEEKGWGGGSSAVPRCLKEFPKIQVHPHNCLSPGLLLEWLFLPWAV